MKVIGSTSLAEISTMTCGVCSPTLTSHIVYNSIHLWNSIGQFSGTQDFSAVLLIAGCSQQVSLFIGTWVKSVGRETEARQGHNGRGLMYYKCRQKACLGLLDAGLGSSSKYTQKIVDHHPSCEFIHK